MTDRPRCGPTAANDTASRRRRCGAAGTALLLAGAVAYVGLVDPHRPGLLFPPCPFRLLTGWNCPACGGLRMVHDLLHGNLAAAVMDNVFLLVAIPVLTAWILLRRHRRTPVSPATATAAGAVLAVTAIVWTVVRNLPGFPLVPTLLTG